MGVVVLVVAPTTLLMFIFSRHDPVPALARAAFISNQHRHSTLSSNLRAFSTCPLEWECNVLPALHFGLLMATATGILWAVSWILGVELIVLINMGNIQTLLGQDIARDKKVIAGKGF